MGIRSKLMQWLGIQSLLEVVISMEERITRLENKVKWLEQENSNLKSENNLIDNNKELFNKEYLCKWVRNDEDVVVKLDDEEKVDNG